MLAKARERTTVLYKKIRLRCTKLYFCWQTVLPIALKLMNFLLESSNNHMKNKTFLRYQNMRKFWHVDCSSTLTRTAKLRQRGTYGNNDSIRTHRHSIRGRNLSCGGMSPVWHQDLSSRAARTTFRPPSVERSLPGRRIEKTAVRYGTDEIALIRVGYWSVNQCFASASSNTYA